MLSQECYADMVTSFARSLRTRFIRSLLVCMALVLPGLLLPIFAASWTVNVQPIRLVNGAPVLFQVKAPARLQSLRGTWLGHEISFSLVSASKTWVALGGVSLETAPGTYPLELSG